MYMILHIPTGLYYTCRADKISIFTPHYSSSVDTIILAEQILKKAVRDGNICITFELRVMRYIFEYIDVSQNEFEIIKVKDV